jgi:hypothetical protein
MGQYNNIEMLVIVREQLFGRFPNEVEILVEWSSSDLTTPWLSVERLSWCEEV